MGAPIPPWEVFIVPGPPPKHPSARARRNNPNASFTSLPAEGRVGPTPAWPLQPDVRMAAERDLAQDRIASLQSEIEEAEDGRTRGRLRRQLHTCELTFATLSLQMEQSRDLEVALWSDLWSTPQAIMWEAARSHREVAQYVRWKIRGEQGDLDAAKEARMLSDRLGLNPLAMLRLRVEIQRVDEVEERGRRRRAAPSASAKGKKPPDDPRSILSIVS